MELSPQLVNAAIQRVTEIASDVEETSSTAPPTALYSNSLLQQFEVQTQMLSTTPATPSQLKELGGLVTVAATPLLVSESSVKSVDGNVKRKRGRPKKMVQKSKNEVQEYTTEPNVSPDSGIQDSPEHASSPPPSPPAASSPASKMDAKKKHFDRILYANTGKFVTNF